MTKRAWLFALLLVSLVASVAVAYAVWPQEPTTSQREYAPRPAGSLTFAKDIAPIVWQNCSVCHRPGESGPFNLLAYQDVRKRAGQIAEVTQSRFMPPWLPDSQQHGFRDERRLTTEQIGMIRQWAAEGAKPGNLSQAPPTPKFAAGWRLGEPDLIVSLPRPYTLPADGADVFRNFVIPVDVSGRRYVKALEIRPGNPKVVHHAVLTIDETRSSRRLDEKDPAPGFAGMVAEEAQIPDGHFLGWTPGKGPDAGAEGLSWRLNKGADLVLQLHLLPSGKPEEVQVRIGLYFSPEPPSKFARIIRLGSQTIDIPAGAPGYSIRDSYKLPVDADLLAIYPHAHFLGKEMTGFAILPDGSKQSLIHIKQWDFNWQNQYYYQRPVRLPKGTELIMRYTYDNSSSNARNPHHPPRRVTFGPNSSDEMGDLWLQLLPVDPTDWLVLSEDFNRKLIADEIAGLRQTVENDADNAEAHATLALRYKQTGRTADSFEQFAEALRLAPDDSETHNNFGNLLQQMGNVERALTHYRRALDLEPRNFKAHNNLGAALRLAGEPDEALGEFRLAVEQHPDYAAAHNNLANMLSLRSDWDQAIQHYRQALAIDPDYASAENNLRKALRLRGRRTW